jgi:hypothetical protein
MKLRARVSKPPETLNKKTTGSPSTSRLAQKQRSPVPAVPLKKKVSFSDKSKLPEIQQHQHHHQQIQPEVPSAFLTGFNTTSGSRAAAVSTRYPRSSPPANAFPLRSFVVNASHTAYYDSSDSYTSDSDSDSDSDDYTSDESESSDSGTTATGNGAFPGTGPKSSRDLEGAARLLLSVSPHIEARPRSVSLMEPLESLAGLASLDGAQFSQAPGSINKLHACLSGLSRGSQASYGSLASFQDERSLFNAMAPQSFLLSNLTRQRERKKLKKKKKKALRKKLHAASKKRKRMASQQQQQHESGGVSFKKPPRKRKRSNSTSSTSSTSSKSSKSSKSTKSKSSKTKKSRKKKIKKWDAEAEAAAASAKLIHEPINPDCPPSLTAQFGKIYNTYGRVGIYTPQQRLLIMSRYRQKRTNRQWKKVVRYNCRKNLADTRLRIKGRFVRKDSEEAKAYFAKLKQDLVRSSSSLVLFCWYLKEKGIRWVLLFFVP